MIERTKLYKENLIAHSPNLSLFFSARAKLSFWYVMVILAINLTISSLFFLRTNLVLENEFIRIEERIMARNGQVAGENPDAVDHIRLNILKNNLSQTRTRILHQLIMINGFIALLAGISSYWLAGQTLQPIEEAMDEQKRFIGDAAHELKTPLTALRSNIEVQLMDKNITKSTQSVLSELLIDVDNLQNLITSLLQLAKVEHQTNPTDKVDVIRLTTKAVKHLSPVAKQKEIKIEFVQPKIAEAFTLGDAVAIYELLLIFLDNAIKYSHPKDKITVSLTVSSRHLQVSIADQGIGIAKHHLPHIFDRFYRVDTARTHTPETEGNSYGLGLSVAKKIIDWHNASVKVSSQPQKGSTFTLTFQRVR